MTMPLYSCIFVFADQQTKNFRGLPCQGCQPDYYSVVFWRLPAWVLDVGSRRKTLLVFRRALVIQYYQYYQHQYYYVLPVLYSTRTEHLLWSRCIQMRLNAFKQVPAGQSKSENKSSSNVEKTKAVVTLRKSQKVRANPKTNTSTSTGTGSTGSNKFHSTDSAAK